MAKQHSEKDTLHLHFSHKEEEQLVKAVEKVNGLKQCAKLTMASVRIPDLKKKHEELKELKLKQERENEEARGSVYKRLVQNSKEDALMVKSAQNDITRSNMNINWMLSEAREQVNDAIGLLMQ